MTSLVLPHRWSGAALASYPLVFAAVVLGRRARRRLKSAGDRRRLQAMPDHLLADMGLVRADIEDAQDFARIRRLPDCYRL